jgi:cytochrome b subunit of formate dehydrogenase
MEKEKRYFRFDIFQRIEHIVLLLSFTLLGLTGLPQKYASSSISQTVIAYLGGIEATRIIHRSAATIFVLLSIYHAVVIGYKLFVQRREATMLPGKQDAIDAKEAFFFNLGFSKEHPKLPRYNFAEKAEYWALLWGLVVMAVTGFILWNPITATKLLPGQFIPAAKAAHGGEAVLAVLAIFLWHFYGVHLKHLNLSMFNGSMSHGEMEEEHAKELEQIESGAASPQVDPAELKRRRTIYVPVAAVIVVVALLVIFEFTTAESTAITTLPVEQRAEIYVPQTPTPIPPTPTVEVKPTATPDTSAKAGATATPNGSGEAAATHTWDNGIGAIFDADCSACHGTVAGLNLQSYADAMKGSSSGPVILPGDPDNSLVIKKTKDGGHSGKFSADELQAVIDWIKASAPEK